jgi:hypothetical protein
MAVLTAVQALLGSISPHFLEISLRVRPGSDLVEVFFALDACTEAETDLIGEIEVDMSATGLPDFDVIAHSWTGPETGPQWPGYGLRQVYRRYDWSATSKE